MLIIYALTIIFLISSCGWGFLYAKATSQKSIPFYILSAYGISILLVIGGCLNALQMVSKLSLTSIIIIGIANYIILFVPNIRIRQLKNSIFILLFTFIFMYFYALYLVPTTTFNLGDDHNRYFVFIKRMLTTGTAYGDPLIGIGQNTLGGNTFLQAFILSYLPFSYANFIDICFGQLMLLLSVFLFSLDFTKKNVFSILLLLIVFFINPLKVNTSTLYLGSFLTFVLLIKVYHIFANNDFTSNSYLHIGLLLAALASQKMNLVIFLLLLITLLFLYSTCKHSFDPLKFYLKVIFSALLFLSPWLIMFFSQYLSWHKNTYYIDMPTILHYSINTNFYLYSSSINSTANVFIYTLTIILTTLLGVFAFYKKNKTSVFYQMSAFSFLFCFILFIELFGFYFWGRYQSLRLFIPSFLAIFPFLMIISLNTFDKKSYYNFLLCSLILLMSLNFVNFYHRYTYAINENMILDFKNSATTSNFKESSRKHLTDEQYYKSLQAHIPKGKSILVWSSAAYNFDFQRNHLFMVVPNGLMFSKSMIPKMPYIIWEDSKKNHWELSKKFALTGMGYQKQEFYFRTTDALNTFEKFKENSKIIYHDKKYIILDTTEN